MSSIFTKIIQREIPADIVYENDTIIAFRDIAPKAPVHILIVPKKELPTLNDITPDNHTIMIDILIAAQSIAQSENIAEQGYRLVMNCNDYGGQTVFHVHCHLLGGTQLGWNPA